MGKIENSTVLIRSGQLNVKCISPPVIFHSQLGPLSVFAFNNGQRFCKNADLAQHIHLMSACKAVISRLYTVLLSDTKNKYFSYLRTVLLSIYNCCYLFMFSLGLLNAEKARKKYVCLWVLSVVA